MLARPCFFPVFDFQSAHLLTNSSAPVTKTLHSCNTRLGETKYSHNFPPHWFPPVELVGGEKKNTSRISIVFFFLLHTKFFLFVCLFRFAFLGSKWFGHKRNRERERKRWEEGGGRAKWSTVSSFFSHCIYTERRRAKGSCGCVEEKGN